MKSALVALRSGIQELRWHIRTTDIEWDLLAASNAILGYDRFCEHRMLLQ